MAVLVTFVRWQEQISQLNTYVYQAIFFRLCINWYNIISLTRNKLKNPSFKDQIVKKGRLD